MDRNEYIEVLKNYKKSCLYMKQINSNKANRYSRYNNILTYTTLIFTVILSAIAFIDKKMIVSLFKSNNYCSSATDIVQADIINLCLSGLALFVLILTLINLLYRFQERSSIYFQTVTTLASISRDIEAILNIKEEDDVKFLDAFNIIKAKYNITMDYLPQHTDKEFIKAKYDIKLKEEISSFVKKNKVPSWMIYTYCWKLIIGIKKNKGTSDANISKDE